MPRLAALVFGALPALAFPEPAWWWSGYVALVPLLLIVTAADKGREAALRAWLGGSGFFLAVTHWLVPKVGPGLIPIALLVGLSWIPWGWVAWRSSARRIHPSLAVVLTAAAWVAGEFLRSSEYLGGPWGLLGASQWNNRTILPAAAFAGVWVVSFVVCGVNAGLAFALLRGRTRAYRLGALVSGAVLVAAAAIYAAGYDISPSRSLRLAGVQPGVIHNSGERFEEGLRLTRDLRGSFDLVVWGESSVGAAGAHPESVEKIADTARSVGAPILVNIDARRGPGGIFKSSVLVDDKALGSYDKMRLVPFGEYIPFRSIFGWLPNVSDAPPEDRRRGTRLEILRSDALAIGPLVCFESAFPDMSRRLAAMGADLIVVQSATTTFQGSWAPEQHASLAAVRAVESGRPVLHATLTGVSAGFDAAGRRHAWVGTDTTGTYELTLPLSSFTTSYARWGDWFPLASVIALVALVVDEIRRRAATRSRTEQFDRTGEGGLRPTATPPTPPSRGLPQNPPG